jgi:hypothetical protein
MLSIMIDSFILKTVLLSTIVWKFNKLNRRHERTLIITNKRLYNVSRQNLLTQAISVCFNSFSIKRKVEISRVAGITASDTSTEFVIHVTKEYDYRYASPERRDRIFKVLVRAYYGLINDSNLPFYWKASHQVCKWSEPS